MSWMARLWQAVCCNDNGSVARGTGTVQRTIKALVFKEFAATEARLRSGAPLGWESTLRWGLFGTCLTLALFGIGLLMPTAAMGVISLVLAWVFLVLTLLVGLRDVGIGGRVTLTATIPLLAGFGLVQIVRHPPQSEILAAIRGIPDAVYNRMAPLFQKTSATSSPTASLEEPVLHIEPEREIVFSTHPGQKRGVYTITLHNTGVDVEVMEVEKRYFLAQRGKNVVIKRLGDLTDSHKGLLQHEKKFLISLDFNSYLNDIKEVAANFTEGPSRAGVYIVARFRRHADGKNFAISRAYGLFNFDAAAIFTEGTSMDGVPVQLRSQFLTLHEVVPYLDAPEHWTSVTKEVTSDASGNVHVRQF
jgi:hypothetical protein